MHVIWNLLRTELSAHAATLRTFAVVAAVIAGTNLAMGGATHGIAVCVMTVAFLPGLLFAQDERAHLDTMYSILPVTRAKFVVARYLLVALIAAAATLAGLVVARNLCASGLSAWLGNWHYTQHRPGHPSALRKIHLLVSAWK